MSKPKQVFSIRIDPEILRRIRRLAGKERTTIGAIVRESLDEFLKSKEEKNENKNHRENHSGWRNSSGPRGLQPNHQSEPRTMKEEEKTMENEFYKRQQEDPAEMLLSVLPEKGKEELLFLAMKDPEALRPNLTETVGMGNWLDSGNEKFLASVVADAIERLRIVKEEERL